MDFDVKEQLKLKKFMPNKERVKNLTSFFYAFSDYTRLRIIMLLTIKPSCVSNIASILNVNQTTISHQLKILKSLKIVSCDRSGKNIYYYIENADVENVLNVSVECV